MKLHEHGTGGGRKLNTSRKRKDGRRATTGTGSGTVGCAVPLPALTAAAVFTVARIGRGAVPVMQDSRPGRLHEQQSE